MSKFVVSLGFALVLGVAGQTSAQSKGCEDWTSEEFWSDADAQMISNCLDLGLSVESRVSQLKIGEEGLTPLHLAAAFSPNIEILSVLLRAGSNVNTRTKRGFTALHLAASLNNSEVTKLLIEFGADVSAGALKSDMNVTPLHVAVTNPDMDVAQSLLDAGAFVDVRANEDRTPLHLASGNGITTGIIELLVAEGADVNAITSDGETPLHLAAKHSQSPEVIELLLSLGADGALLDKSGNTPFESVPFGSDLRETGTYWKLNDAQYK